MAGRAGCLNYADEVYRKFTYQEALHATPADVPGLDLSCADRARACS